MNIVNLNPLESSGGIQKIEVYKITDVLNCPHLITPNNVDKIVFRQSSDGIELYPVANEIEMKEPSKLDTGGTKYNIKGGFTVKTQNVLVDHKLYAASQVPVMVKVYFFNGNKRLYGSVVSPLFFSFQPYNGKEIENGSGYRVTINGTTTQRPIYFDAVTA